MHLKNNIAALVIVSCLNACSSSNDYTGMFTPKETQPESFIESIDYDAVGGTSSARWWENINDPLLNGYVETLISDNLSIKQAAERVTQAKEAKNISKSFFFPNVGGDAGGSRSFASSSSNGGSRAYTNNYNANLTTSWEIDLFGKIRKSVDSADAAFQATTYDQIALTHSLIADLLRLRVEISVNQNLLHLAQDNADNRNSIFDIVSRRYNLGTGSTSLSDVYIAEDNFMSAKKDIYEFERLLQNATYRLDTLLGKTPGYTKPTLAGFPMLAPPMNTPICVPAALLDRRPDLKASELRIVAKVADIDVAIRDLYPSINLGGSLGYSGNSTSNLFSAEQLAGSILGNITARLFEGGSLRANIRLQESEAREQSAAYADLVLSSIQEVETNLHAEKKLQQELEASVQSVEALRKAEKITENRYLQGIETLQDFLTLQQRRYTAEQLMLVTQQQKWDARIALYLALGGDWLSTSTNDTSCNEEL